MHHFLWSKAYVSHHIIWFVFRLFCLFFSGCNNNAEHDDIASENDDETHSNVDEDLDEEDEEINVT